MKSHVEFESILPPFLLLGIMIAAVIVVVYSYRREGLGKYDSRTVWILSALRLLSIAAILFILAKPVIYSLEELHEPATVMVLVDSSQSMATNDVLGEVDRFEKAKTLAQVYTRELAERFRVRPYVFSTYAVPVPVDEIAVQKIHPSSGTNLSDSIEEASVGEAGQTTGGIVLLSDGAHNTGPPLDDVVTRLAEKSIPVYTVGIGEKMGFLDLEIRGFTGPSFAYAGETAELSVRVANYGLVGPAGGLVVRLDEHVPPQAGKPVDPRVGTTISKGDMPIPPPGSERNYKLEFELMHEGVYHLTAEVPAAPGESLKENNKREILIETSKSRIRVLYVEGTPRWEYKFLQQTLRTDRRFLASGLVQYQSGRFLFQGSEIDKNRPWAGRIHTTPLELRWENIDAVILGDVSASSFTAETLARLRSAVDEGKTSLVFIPGETYGTGAGFADSSLAGVVPYEKLGQRVGTPVYVRPNVLHPDSRVLTFVGLEGKEVFSWDKIGPCRGYYPVVSSNPSATALAQAEVDGKKIPVMLLMRTPEGGRTLGLTVQDTWHWRIMNGEKRANEAHQILWRRILRWLVTGNSDDPEVGIDATVDRPEYIRGEKVVLSIRGTVPDGLTLSESKIEIDLVEPDGVGEPFDILPSLTPGAQERSFSFNRVLSPRRPGKYTVRASLSSSGGVIDKSEISFNVSDTLLETTKAGLNDDLLKKIAADTGGRYYPASNAMDLAGQIPDKENIDIRTVKNSLWDNPLLFIAIVLFLAGEWAVRKKRDMA